MVRGRVAGDSVADVGPASVMVGNIVQGNRLASAQGRDMGVLDEDSDNAKKVRYSPMRLVRSSSLIRVKAPGPLCCLSLFDDVRSEKSHEKNFCVIR